jgi:hypothetical protein
MVPHNYAAPRRFYSGVYTDGSLSDTLIRLKIYFIKAVILVTALVIGMGKMQRVTN